MYIPLFLMKIPTCDDAHDVRALNSDFPYLGDEEPLHVLQDLPGVRVGGRRFRFLSFRHGLQSTLFPSTRTSTAVRVLPPEGPFRQVNDGRREDGTRAAEWQKVPTRQERESGGGLS